MTHPYRDNPAKEIKVDKKYIYADTNDIEATFYYCFERPLMPQSLIHKKTIKFVSSMYFYAGTARGYTGRDLFIKYLYNSSKMGLYNLEETFINKDFLIKIETKRTDYKIQTEEPQDHP